MGAVEFNPFLPEFVADPDSLNGIVSHDGKLIFYQNQVIRWLLMQQQKGG